MNCSFLLIWYTPDDGLVRLKHARVSVTQSTQATNKIYLDGNLHLIL
jgi:hypothetical protein